MIIKAKQLHLIDHASQLTHQTILDLVRMKAFLDSTLHCM